MGGAAAGVDVGAVGLGRGAPRRRRRAPAAPRARPRRRRRWRSRPRPAARRGRGPRSTRATDSAHRLDVGRAVDVTVPTASPVRAGPRLAAAEQRVQLGLERRPRPRRTACGRPAANSLMPLSANGLCDAEITAPATPSAAASHATAGVGTTPSSATSTPSAASPATSAASSSGPERRVSRPTTNARRRRAPGPRPARSASTELRRQLDVGDPAHAVGPELQHRYRPQPASSASASSTAGPCGPS